MSEHKFPSPEDLQKEFESLLRQRFSGNAQVFAQHLGPRENGERLPTTRPIESSFAFNLKPKDIKGYLDRFVIGQDEAKKALSIAVCDHYNHVRLATDGQSTDLEYSKQNVLILGPTGVGKTYLVRKIASLVGVPFVKADATRFSETGYVGANVDDLIRDLVNQAGGDISRAQYGIVYLDEADKLATPRHVAGRDVNGRGVQFGLLKLLEETDVDLAGTNDMQSQLKAFMEFQRKGRLEKQIINTRHILFIVSGAFTHLPDIVAKRQKTRALGFHARTSTLSGEDDLLSSVETQDFIEYGFEPEFIGRLPVRVACRQLTANDLVQVMKRSEGSIIRQYLAAFKAYNIRASFSDCSLRAIAEIAASEKTGARALMTVCERIFRNYKFELPSIHLRELNVTASLVRDPVGHLTALMAKNQALPHSQQREQIHDFEDEFLSLYDLDIHFDDEALSLLAELAAKDGQDARDLCREYLENYEYGLKLVEKNTGQSQFVLRRALLDDPKAYLEGLLQAPFGGEEHARSLPRGPQNPTGTLVDLSQ